ncbi:HPP family transmembrane protein [Skeletonema marinoi]|uniref:HPP family transmembrane protein n=1 Tax=Skeletonema marinoi TaxID=267567 RepID=A0AAD8Y299_9STRA|nr:HPP family transmembrane protein [Skeletonema marinoi]
MKGPARMSAPDCAIIFIMVTLAMLTILRMNDAFEDAHPDNIYKWHLNGGWYASTMCIVFALSSAPVGQPRQIIGAHIINALVGLAFQQIPSTPAMDNFSDFAKLPPGQRGMPLFWKESFAVGVGVSLQAWLGVMHPPATGLAFSFANTDRYQLSNLVVVMLADVMLIVLATVLLNLQKNKQYPIFWFGMNWNYPSGKMHQLTSKTRNTTAELTERITRRNIGKRQPQDHTPTSTAANSGGVENV